MRKKVKLLARCTYSYLKGFQKCEKNENTVFLAFLGKLGDMIMFLDALEGYKKRYSSADGYKLVLGCRKEVWKMLQAIGADQGISFVEITREKLTDLSYLRNKCQEIRSVRPSLLLHVREADRSEDMLFHAVNAEESVIFRGYRTENKGKVWNYFSKRTYTHQWEPDREMDQLSCYAEMLRQLGLKDYQSKIALLPKMQNSFAGLPENYVVVCPGASVDNKCWPSSRYAEVIDHIVEKYNKQVVLCGGKNDQKVSAEIVAQVRNSQAVHDITGQTTLEEWIATIQNAEFALTNESGSIHIAASCRVPSVCIGEQKYGDKWLPYRPEYVRPEDCMPIMVRGKKLDCFFCAARNFQRSESCKECYQKNGVIQCVYEVTAQMIMDAVDSMLCGKEQECV